MKVSLVATATTLLILTLGAADARQGRYCIEMAEQGGTAGPPQCLFETLEQCIASKTSPSERCMLNPFTANEKRR